MNEIFADTSFLIASALTDDQYHGRAMAWLAMIQGRLLVTDYVLLEFLDALSFPHLRDLAADTTILLRGGPGITLIAASDRLFEEGLKFYQKHQDKAWGITDCISFVVMKEHGIHQALSSDHHFEQAGFRALLREEPT